MGSACTKIVYGRLNDNNKDIDRLFFGCEAVTKTVVYNHSIFQDSWSLIDVKKYT